MPMGRLPKRTLTESVPGLHITAELVWCFVGMHGAPNSEAKGSAPAHGAREPLLVGRQKPRVAGVAIRVKS